MKPVGKIVCLIGPSGVGKTSYAMRLVDKYGFVLPIIVTTRQPRSDDGKHYRYVKEGVFIEMTCSKVLLEWDRYTDYYYGTLVQSVEESICSNNCPGVVLDLTPSGCRKVMDVMPLAIPIALLPDDPAWLIERLKSRNSQPLAEIQTRTALLQRYLDDVNLLTCKKVYVSFSPDSWDKTFETIEKIIFEPKSPRG